MLSYDRNKTGRVHSLFTGGMVDGPGIRSVVFLAGCNLRCKYCHNPDTWAVNRGDIMTVGDVLDEVLKYTSYYRFSGGGITVSGGEPLMQPDFLTELMAACRAHDLHTTLDTSGCGRVDVAERVLPNTSLLLIDIKSFNPAVYLELTGQPLDKTLAVLDVARRLNVPTWIRYVLVPGWTDNLDELRELADYLRSFGNVEKAEVLPFHKNGEYKWADLRIAYELQDTLPPTPEQVRDAQEILTL